MRNGDNPPIQSGSGRRYGPWAYLWLAVGLFLAYLLLSPFVTLTGTGRTAYAASFIYDGDIRVRMAMAVLLGALAVVFAVLLFRKRMTDQKAIVMLILTGVLLRFGYMLYTPFFIHGHDVSAYGQYGHLDYIYQIYTTGRLPGTNAGQFYHPPFEHILCAAVARLYEFVTERASLDTIFESCRLVPCFASCAVLIVCKRLLDELNFSNRAKSVAMTVIVFHPTFILLSASINNDMLTVFFMLTAFLYTLRWQKEPTFGHILLAAVSIGCAMSTKLSGVAVAAVTAAVFLTGLIRRYRENRTGAIVGQFAAFSAVVFPLGLWYSVRNLILFGQPLGYVEQIPKTSELYIGDVPLTKRFFSFSLHDIFTRIYCAPFDDSALWPYVVQCALFGEYTFSAVHRVPAVLLLVSSLLLILVSLFSMGYYVFFARSENRLAVLSFAGFWLVLMVLYVDFNIKYPFGCTMDFRYIAPTVVTGAAFIGLLSDKLTGSVLKSTLFALLVYVILVFSVSSAVFFII